MASVGPAGRPGHSNRAGQTGFRAGAAAIAAFAAGMGLSADLQPPQILVLPPSEDSGNAIRARVVDDGEVARVTLHVRTENNDDYRPMAMQPEGDDVYVAHLSSSIASGRLVYFIEATDRSGNGPAMNGSADRPFRFKFVATAPEMAQQATARRPTWIWLTPLVPLLGGLMLVLRLMQRPDREFWAEILSPLWHLEGAELAAALDELCSRHHWHPYRGDVTVEREEALAWLARLQGSREQRRRHTPLLHLGPQAQAAMRLQLAEDVFWIGVLEPVAAAPPARAEELLRRLARRAYDHPVDGERTFDIRTLRERMSWARRIDIPALLSRWEAVNCAGSGQEGIEQGKQNSRRVASGLSLVELLVVVALLGIAVAIGALYLKPMATPLQSGGQMLEGLLKQTRAKAMATTTVHRIRPLDVESLIVEYADSCTSAAWTLDPRMDVDLPANVTLADTAWSVCFSSRGIAADNVFIALNHPQHGSRSLEVLVGGTLKWLP